MWLWALLPICLAVFGTVGIWTVPVVRGDLIPAGIFSSIGISITGYFQESVLMGVHLLAGFLGPAYLIWVHLYLTYRAQDQCWVGPAWMTCCTLCTILFTAASVCEWALVMLFLCLFGLFGAEFRRIDCLHLTVQKPALKNASVEMNGLVLNGEDHGCPPLDADLLSQTRIEPVSLSAGHRPTISPRTVALALGVSPVARDSTE
ncbi:modulator of macroautophagy TMEM150B-like [Odontesthes bonariensis]|uniref:modulator of macroautophagy TMEM150B-like n=1 Tax=Odontesthes bonariensis TaxID=219752 RepID=UPI003F581F98